MLTHAHISDFAIIESLELDFAAGLTVLTGETGAGKSILIDALGLALGDRADATTVRHGAERAEISVGFDIRALPGIGNWLMGQELADDNDECLIRRIITREGRSKAWINGRTVPVTMLKELGDRLVDIHGQHEHQSLMSRDAQRNLLDAFGEHHELRSQLETAWNDWQAAKQKLDTLRRSQQDSDDRRDLLTFQVSELLALGLGAGEVAELESEHHRLAHISRLTEGTQSAFDLAYDNDETSAYKFLSNAAETLAELAEIDAQLQPVVDNLNTAMISLQEGAEDLRRYISDLELDPERLDFVEARLNSIQQLSRKHRVEPEALIDLAEQLKEELDALENAEAHIARLEATAHTAEKHYLALAKRLSDARKKTATALGESVSRIMQELAMAGGRFAIAVEPLPKQARHGIDQVEFQVSANPGQPLKPLSKVASGGELSRISLAIQVIASNASDIPVMIFDEVDAGVGGGVAELIGRRMRALGKHRQVFCVTHLPQVASQAHHHCKVEKRTSADETHTSIQLLDDANRVEELARMLGGVNITDTTREHAREMIKAADVTA